MDCVRIGIIGLGNMGSAHSKSLIEGLVPGMVLTAVADRQASRRSWAKENLPDTVSVYAEGMDLIDSAAVDAILIAVPHYQHPELAMAGFSHRLHVMCEKPAGVYTKQVREMNDAAKRSQVTFGMMFNQRTNCVYRKMHELIQSGKLGEIRRVNWLITDWYRTQTYYDSGAWRATWAGEGGGVLLNQCPHNLDLLQWICGMPVRIRAFCHEGKWHDIEVEDDVTAYMEYPNGATGVFITTTGDAPGTNRFEVTTDMGKLVCENEKLTFYRLAVPNSVFIRESKESFATPEMTIEEIETDGLHLAHVGVLQAFTGNILRGEPLVADGTEGINGLTLSNAMHLSSWLGKPVDIPFDEELFLEKLNIRRASSKHKEVSNPVVSDTSGSY